MKPNNYKIAALIFLSSLSTAKAGEIKIDFDGVSLPVTHKNGVERQSLVSFVNAAALEGAIPVQKYGGIPTVPGAECVNMPGAPCGGSSNGHGGTVGVPDFNAPYDIEGTFGALVCINRIDTTTECLYRSTQENIQLLQENIIKKYIKGIIKERLTYHFPNIMEIAKIQDLLKKVAIDTVESTQKQLNADLQKMVPMGWESPEERAKKLAMIAADEKAIREWKKAALIAAYDGSSWEEIYAKVYQFKGGPAYEQLGKMLLGKEYFRNTLLRLKAAGLIKE